MRLLQRLFDKRPCTDCPLTQGELGDEPREARQRLVQGGDPERINFLTTPEQRELIFELRRKAGAHEAEVIRACIALAAPLIMANPRLVSDYQPKD